MDNIEHSGIAGMHWGRWHSRSAKYEHGIMGSKRKSSEDDDSSMSSEDAKRYKQLSNKKLSEMSNQEIKEYLERRDLEKRYREKTATPSLKKEALKKAALIIGGALSAYASKKANEIVAKKGDEFIDMIKKRKEKMKTNNINHSLHESLSDIGIELSDNDIEHHGIRGMKWHKHLHGIGDSFTATTTTEDMLGDDKLHNGDVAGGLKDKLDSFRRKANRGTSDFIDSVKDTAKNNSGVVDDAKKLANDAGKSAMKKFNDFKAQASGKLNQLNDEFKKRLKSFRNPFSR